jgi:hypothetical protein
LRLPDTICASCECAGAQINLGGVSGLSRLDEARGRVLWIATPWHVDDATQDQIGDKRSCTLIQRVGSTLEQYDQEVVNAGSDYPGLLVAA